MLNQQNNSFPFNWETAQVVQPNQARAALQKYYQERYGDRLTIAIKAARRNLRKEQWQKNKIRSQNTRQIIKHAKFDALNSCS